MLTNMELVSKDNFSNFWQSGKGLVESDETKSRRPKPIKQASQDLLKLRYWEDKAESFWDGLKAGVDSATRELSNYNAHVDWIIPKGSHTEKGFNISAEIYGAAINECVDKKYNAVCVGIYDKNLVPYINKAIDKGIVFATYNSEPMSLRGLLKTLTERTNKLIEFSNSLSKAAKYSIDITNNNADSIKSMVQSLNDEANSVNNANSNMTQISVSVDSIARESHEQKVAVDTISDSAKEIAKAIESANSIATVDCKIFE